LLDSAAEIPAGNQTREAVRPHARRGFAVDRTTRRDQRLDRIAAGDRWRSEDDLVFTNVVGSPTYPPKVRAEFNRVIAVAELGEGWTPNMLRHSAASLMSDAGVPLERIADQLGHEDTRTLSAHYRHQVRPTIDAAMILDRVLGSASGG